MFAWLQTASAGDPGSMRLMITGDNEDENSIPRGSQPFKRVMSALVTGLKSEGYSYITDETTLSNGITDEHKKVNLDELIDVARDIGADVIVFINIYFSNNDSNRVRKVKAHIKGRLLSVFLACHVDDFESEKKLETRVAENCGRKCIMEAVGRSSKELAENVVVVLRNKLYELYLNPHSSETSICVKGSRHTEKKVRNSISKFVLIFNGLDPEEQNFMQTMLRGMPGFKNLHPKSDKRGHSFNRVWLYRTTQSLAKLKRNLRKAIKLSKVLGTLSVSGNEIKITKTGSRK